jgi:hypothetical protein
MGLRKRWILEEQNMFKKRLIEEKMRPENDLWPRRR